MSTFHERRILTAEEKNIPKRYLRKDGYLFVEPVLNLETGKIGEKAFCKGSYDQIPKFKKDLEYYYRHNRDLVIEYSKYIDYSQNFKNILVTEKNIDELENLLSSEDYGYLIAIRIIEHVMMYDNENNTYEKIEHYCEGDAYMYDYPFDDGYYCDTRKVLIEKLFYFLIKYNRYEIFDIIVKNYGLKIFGCISSWLSCFGKFYNSMGALFLEDANFLPKIFERFLYDNERKICESQLDEYYDESLQKFIDNFFNYYLLVIKIDLFLFIDTIKKSDFDLFFKDFVDNLVLLDDDDKIFNIIKKFEESEKLGHDNIRLH